MSQPKQTVGELLQIVATNASEWASNHGFGDQKQLLRLFDDRIGVERLAGFTRDFLLKPFSEGMLRSYLMAEFEKGLLFVSQIGDLGLDDDVRDRFIKAIRQLTAKDISQLEKIAKQACKIMVVYNKQK